MRHLFAVLVVGLLCVRAAAQPTPDSPSTSSGVAPSAAAAAPTPNPAGTKEVSKPDEKASKPDDAKKAVDALDDWDKKTSDFDKLKTPDSPAFVILGVSPSEIQRPTTPKAVAVALGTFVSGTDIAIPKNFAIEVSPYWLFSHPDLQLKNYRDEWGRRLYRSFSVSVGTAQTDRTLIDATGMAIKHEDSDVGIGVRSTLFQGETDECTKQIKKLNDLAIEISKSTLTTADEDAELAKKGPVGSDAYNKALEELLTKRKEPYEKALKDLQTKSACLASVASATGFSLSFAGAVDVHVADSKLTKANSDLAGKAAWLNASYDTDALAGVLLLRYASHDVDTGTQSVLDSGVRGVYKAKNYTASAEGLARYRFNADKDKWAFKVDVGVEYELSSETAISVTFGKDFTFSENETGSLFSLANLKWDLGKPKQ